MQRVTAPPVYDIVGAIDAAPWSGRQKFALAMCALAVILDGFDNQILGFAIPGMIKEWGVARADFAHVLALGFLGMTVGTPIGGLLGDRIGRKPTLVLAVLVFGAATAAAALSRGIFDLSMARTIAGIGLGGAMPAATTLIAELTPERRRSLAVTLGIVCIPLGGLVGGLIAAQVLPLHGWRALFVIGGVAPVLVGLILMALLPESPQFLARKSGNAKRVAQRLQAIGCDVPDNAVFIDSSTIKVDRPSFRALFGGAMTRDTLALWGAFFFCLLPLYVLYAWTPTLLTGAGIGIAIASTAVAIFNLGGILGSLFTAFLIGRLGSRIALLGMLAGAVVSALLLATIDLGPESRTAFMTCLFAEGFFILGVQVTLYALAAFVYPTAIRSTGVGATAGVGRIGAIISSYVGATVIAAGSGNFFVAVAICLGLSFASLAMLGRHIPRTGTPQTTGKALAV